jgi:small subunit ribosomal protein S13
MTVQKLVKKICNQSQQRLTDVQSDLKKKSLRVLQKVYGLNNFQIEQICKKFGINQTQCMCVLDSRKIKGLLNFIETNLVVEYKLKRKMFLGLEELKKIKALRYKMFELNKPTRGQRTKTNAKTAKKYHPLKGLKLDKGIPISERLL